LRFRLLALCAIATAALAATPGAVDFDRDIRPILADNCFACHGPDEKPRMANLRLDVKDGMFADRGGRPVIVTGDAAASRLYQRISEKDKAKRMPPAYSERSLSEQQIELVRKWIDQGAKWEMHWAYIPPQRPEVPKVQNARDAAWPHNPIDNFILARLAREGLQPSPEADRATLLRRVSFDLTGLPPTPEEIGGRVTSPLYLIVKDCVPVWERAKAAGAEVAMELKEMEYGGKAFSVRDPEGYLWSVGEYDPWAFAKA